MNTQVILYIVLALVVVKWGYELVSGNKLRKNIVGGPLVTRADNPKYYWSAMGLEIGIFAILVVFLLFGNR